MHLCLSPAVALITHPWEIPSQLKQQIGFTPVEMGFSFRLSGVYACFRYLRQRCQLTNTSHSHDPPLLAVPPCSLFMWTPWQSIFPSWLCLTPFLYPLECYHIIHPLRQSALSSCPVHTASYSIRSSRDGESETEAPTRYFVINNKPYSGARSEIKGSHWETRDLIRRDHIDSVLFANSSRVISTHSRLSTVWSVFNRSTPIT